MSTMIRPLVAPTFEVLVVDDDPATVTALTDAVSESARFTRVADGYQALHELTTRRIDAVVMELFLPGAGGIELLRRVRATAPHVPIVVLTHASGPHPELETLGVRHVLHKPVSPELLRTALTEVLTSPARAEPVRRAEETAA